MMRLWSIEGNRQHLDGGAMFGNAPRAVWKNWLPPDENNCIRLASRCLLAEDLDGKTILFETGIGVFFEPKLKDRYGVHEHEHVLLESLQARGYSHEDIDAVVLSHLHFDHAGGLLDGYRDDTEPRLLFPNAQYIIGATHWQRATQPHSRDRASFIPYLPELLEKSGRLELISSDHSPTLGQLVSFSFSDGHTPGLMHAEIGKKDGVVFCSDLIPGRPWVHLPVTMGYDRYPERLIDEKSAFLKDKMERGIHLFFNHDPDCALATVCRDENGRYSTINPQSAVEGMVIGS